MARPRHEASAKAVSLAFQEPRHSIGIPAILLETADLDDPIEVGKEVV
jgi:hypothetical protein